HGPESVPVVEVDSAIGLPHKKALEDRLDDVLGIDFLPDQAAEPGASQAEEPVGIALEHVPGGVVIALAEPAHQIVEGFVFGSHGSEAKPPGGAPWVPEPAPTGRRPRAWMVVPSRSDYPLRGAPPQAST